MSLHVKLIADAVFPCLDVIAVGGAAVLRCIGQPSVSEEKAFDDTGFVWGKLIVDAPWLEPLH